MPPTWRIDFLHLGGWDWAPGFEMFWMEAGAPDGPLALVGPLLRDGQSTVLVNTGPDVTMLPERLLDDEEELLPGLSVFWVGAHHRSSVAVKTSTGQGAVIASDCFMRKENVTENRTLGINESLAETLAAYERIRRRRMFSRPSTTLACSSGIRTESVRGRRASETTG